MRALTLEVHFTSTDVTLTWGFLSRHHMISWRVSIRSRPIVAPLARRSTTISGYRRRLHHRRKFFDFIVLVSLCLGGVDSSSVIARLGMALRRS
ncbi:hypothetical protein DL93DRAFT_857166 [Clavulina sp. PMI_390]|nr:hypothetical protein DL93DRAFT_857166 [Clavulina sp. PMI_390]